MFGLKSAAPQAKTELAPRWRVEAGDYITSGGISPSGDLCVVGLGNGDLVAYALDTGREVFRRSGHAPGVLSVSISPDGQLIASSGQDGTAKVWDRDGGLLYTLPGLAAWIEQVAWAPSGAHLATVSGRFVRVWGRSGESVIAPEPFASSVASIAWSPDSSRLAGACYGGVNILAVDARAKARHLQWKGSLISLVWSPNGRVIACGSQDCSIHFWRLASGKDSQMSGYPFKPKALAWDTGSSLLATAGDAAITIWEFRGKGPEGSRPIQLKGHQGVCTQLASSPGSERLASGSQDTSVLVWDPRRGTKPIGFGFLEQEISLLEWHPKQPGGLLAGGSGGALVFWEGR